MNRKIFLSGAILYLLSSAAAYAQLSVQLNLGQPAYVVAAPVYVAPYPQYYDPHHRNHDFAYWQGQRRQHADNGRHEQSRGEHGRM